MSVDESNLSAVTGAAIAGIETAKLVKANTSKDKPALMVAEAVVADLSAKESRERDSVSESGVIAASSPFTLQRLREDDGVESTSPGKTPKSKAGYSTLLHNLCQNHQNHQNQKVFFGCFLDADSIVLLNIISLIIGFSRASVKCLPKIFQLFLDP